MTDKESICHNAVSAYIYIMHGCRSDTYRQRKCAVKPYDYFFTCARAFTQSVSSENWVMNFSLST